MKPTDCKKDIIIFGKWTEEQLNQIFRQASEINNTSQRIDFLSKLFLSTPYKPSTLIGNKDMPELFVINLAEVDCLTFIEYIEAMRMSGSFEEFKETLKGVRYRAGEIAFEKRKHFFSDWTGSEPVYVKDITEILGGYRTEKVEKILNLKDISGTLFLDGIEVQRREIKYIPAGFIDELVINRPVPKVLSWGLETGDYIGIYSELPGLDVSHVGIAIKYKKIVYLRHASSQKKKVIDEDLKGYLSGKPGIIVFRPKDY
jgi:hypothetical protein